jgi:uncharacterized protein (TIGR02271 family)
MAQESDTTTLVAVFDDYAAAQQASRELTNAGVQQDNIQIQSNLKTGAAGYGGSSEYREPEHNEGGLTGWFHRMFGTDDSETEAGHYGEAVRRGHAILSATVGANQVDAITQTLNRYGAIDIDQRVAAWRQTGYADEAARNRAEAGNQAENSTAVPVIEEELQVGKRAVQRGGVRIYTRVVNQPVEEKVNLREEHVSVQRRSVNRPVSDADINNLRDQTIEVTEMAEEPVVSKRARVKEEIVVGKQATERAQTIRDNVRHTEVQVDRMDAGSPGQSDAAYDYGYQAASNPTYRGRSWSDVENDLRTDYLHNNPSGKWEEAQSSIRRGWDKVTGRL